MDRLEQIALEHGLCTCDEAYTKRGLTAPDCPWHAFAVQEAMEAYATEVARHNLERAAESARTRTNDESTSIIVDKETITSIEIELI